MFRFRLAARFGCTVSELENRLSHRELVEWIAYDRLQPIGDTRMEYMLAQIAMCCLAPWTKRKQTIDAFVPRWGEREEETTERNMRKAMELLGVPKEMIDGQYQ